MSITVRDVIHRYKGADIPAIKGVNAVAAPGRITAVIGPNAAGKSTLLRCVIGALVPTSGAVLIDGEPSHQLTTRKLAGRLAYVPQRPQVAAAFTVREVIELGRHAMPARRRRSHEGDQAKRHASLALVTGDQVEITDLGNQAQHIRNRNVVEIE